MRLAKNICLRSGYWLLVGALATQIGCSSTSDTAEPPSRASALSEATAGACDWYEKCGLIGDGGLYQDRETCENQTRAQLDVRWPASKCEDKIDAAELDQCVTAMAATECQSALDAVNTLATKCPQSAVCAGG